MIRILIPALLCGLLAPPLAAEERAVPSSREDVLLSYGPVVEQVAPAVVNVYARRMVESRNRPGLFDDPFFKRFFGDAFENFGAPQQRQQNALGSGVIVDPSGLIVTNHHVIADADEVSVVLTDRREFEAEVVLNDEDTDTAVLRIDPSEEKLPYLEFRDSDSVQVGDLVLAIGNPFGVGQTVTSGIVSALSRTQVGISDYSFFIQTDAAINPGNSGGALVTMDGKLIGINTAIYSRTGGSIGIGFAVPSNMVRTVVAGAEGGEGIVRPWAGLTGQSLTSDLAEGFGLDRPSGVVVSRVYPGGPGDSAGIRSGDVLLAIDGRIVDDVQALHYRIATRPVGETAMLTVWRGGEEMSLEMALEAPPETPPRNETLLEGRFPLAGARIANLSPAFALEMDRPGAWEGVIVTEVLRGSPAARLGFRAGDLLVAIGGSAIESVADAQSALNGSSAPWRLSVNRDGRVRTITVEG
ncbi:MAG: DegQ family serine endoprotease [Rhodovibrionaceae bacterium]